MAVTGMDNVMRNLNKAVAQIEGRTAEGVVRAGLRVQRLAQQMVPVDTGNLRASASTKLVHLRKGPAAEVGFSAKYSLFVHENLHANFREGGPKFLERAVRELQPDIVRIIAEHAKVPE